VRALYAGTYERAYARNRLVIQALRDAGARVEEAHSPVLERRRDKSQIGLGGLVLLAARLGAAYLHLIPDVALRLLRCDVLVVGYIGQIDMLVLAPVARLMGRPVIFNPLVTLTDTLVEDRRRVSSGSALARAIALLDRVALRLADVVLVDTPENGAYVTERFGVPTHDLVVVGVGADEGVFFAEEAPEASDRLDVLFYGTFIPLHGVETIVRAVAILERCGVPVRIELVGMGQTYAAMRALAGELRIGPDTLIWTDWILFEHLGDRLRRADVALGIFGAGDKAARVVPNKLYQALACGVATVTRRGPAVERLLRDGESALLVPPSDPQALAGALERLLDDKLRARIGAAGLATYRETASRDALARQIAPVVHWLGARR
jgi:glycosyltransferase involved in cell wall biosynthesis